MYKIGFADSFRLGKNDFLLERNMLKNYNIELELYNCKSEDDIINEMVDCDICLVVSSPFTKRVIESLNNCKGILRYGIGLDNIDIEAATERKIQVCYEPVYCIEDVATHAFSMILDLSRKITLMDKEVRLGNWSFEVGYPARRLNNKKLGLIGFGNISRHLAKLVKQFNMDIMTYDPFISKEAAHDEDVELVELDVLIKQSDYISIHCPLNINTYHLLSNDRFNMMKSTAFVINTSRGSIIDTTALVQALLTGKIAGAGLDVHEEEPINIEHPLCKMNNVILTPHAGFYTYESFIRLRTSMMEQTIAIIESKKPAHIFNPEVLS